MHGHHRHPRQTAAPASPEGSRGLLLLLLSVAQLMVILDISAVNVALPDLASDLAITEGDLSWTITSYSLIFGSLLLFGGRAADLLGRRRVFLSGLAVFTVASLVSALADSATMLFAARAGQGLGAAMLSPAALSIITATFTEGRERAKALAVWGAVGGAGAAVGVLLGGALTELVDWRAIFYINLPIGLLLAVGAINIVPADTGAPRWGGLDVRGGLLATASLGALVFALTQAQEAGWTSVQTVGLSAAGLAGLAAFAVLELRTPQPLLRVQRLTDRAIGGGFVMMLAVSAVMFGAFLLSSLYLQNVLGTGALETGLAFVPFALTIGAGVHVGSQLITRAGVRLPLAAGFAIAAAGMLLLSSVGADGSYATSILPGMLIAGIGLGMVLVSVSVSVLTGASEDESGMLSGLNTTGHEIGGSLGVAVLLTIATGALGDDHGPDAAAHLADGLGDAFLAAGIIAGIAGLAALVILPSAKTFLPKLHLAPRVAVH
jgi:EmrB/QacA subfamily drug resistance transporter